MSEWNEWKWTPEKPYPETLETKVCVRYGVDETATADLPVAFWHGNGNWDDSNWHKDCYNEVRITHYKVVK